MEYNKYITRDVNGIAGWNLKRDYIKNDLMGKILYAPNYDGTVTVMQMKNINSVAVIIEHAIL